MVQWENENSVSVVKEKKVVGAVELKEGTTVDILTGTNKGRVAICKATILKVVVSKIAIFKFRCLGIQIQNGQASCRQPHSRPTHCEPRGKNTNSS